MRSKKVDPEFAVADSHDNILRREPERAQNVDAERNQFDIRFKRFLADDVRVELIVLAEPATLRTLVTKHLRQAKPFDRLFEFAVGRRDHAGERRSHLGPQGNGASAFIREVVELLHDFFAGFFLVEIQVFQQRPVVLDEAISVSHFTPAIEDVIAHGAILWGEITEAGERLHGLFQVGMPFRGVRLSYLIRRRANESDASEKRPYLIQIKATIIHADYEMRVRLNKLQLRAVG